MVEQRYFRKFVEKQPPDDANHPPDICLAELLQPQGTWYEAEHELLMDLPRGRVLHIAVLYI